MFSAGENVTQKRIESHLMEGQMIPGEENDFEVFTKTKNKNYKLVHSLSKRKRDSILAGGLIPITLEKRK
ncbi:MAG: hypothetical protein QNJ27_01575 [Simkaniaceae bacterium]|nr:hypothetical protein [Simkaniaceae bacterium]